MPRSRSAVSEHLRSPRWRRAAVAVAALSVALLSACSSSGSGSSGSAAASGAPSGTLKVGLSAAMNTLSPLPFGAKNFYIFQLLYDTAITMKGTTPQPGLVKSWSTAANGLSMTLHLRPGVTYSDGTPFNAAALVWNINWEKQPAQGAHAKALWQDVTAKATGPDTVTLTFTQKMPAILAMLAGAPIVKPNAAASGIGTGPFKVSSFQPGTSLTVVRNPHYWVPGAPHLAKIVFTNYSDTSTAALALRSGTIDMLLQPAATQLSSLKQAGDHFLQAPPSYDGYTPSYLYSLLVNTSKPPLNNPKVRQALSLAFDRSQFVTTALAGQGASAESVLSSSSGAYQASPSTASFDLARAKSLLQAAGVSHLTLQVDSVNILPQTTFMPVYQQDLAKIGVTLKINQIDPATWATVAPTGNFPGLLTQVNAFPDYSPAINFGNHDLSPVKNSQHFSSAQYTSLIQAAGQAENTAKQQAAYEAVAAYLQQQMIIIPLADGHATTAAYSSKVKNVHGEFFGGPDMSAVTISQG